MKRKKRRKAQRGGCESPKQRIMGMLSKGFGEARAAQLVTLRYGEGYWWRTEDFYMATAQSWMNGMALIHSVGRPLQYVMDTDWEEGAGAPIHRAVMELGADQLNMVRLWVYGKATVERLDLTQGLGPVAALLMGSPDADREGRPNG